MNTKPDKKTTEAQAVCLAADITAREAGAAEKRAETARAKFKSAKKVWKWARKAAKRAVKRAEQARKKLTGLARKVKPAKKKTAAKSVIRLVQQDIKPLPKKKPVRRKRATPTIRALTSPPTEAPASPAPPESSDNSSVA